MTKKLNGSLKWIGVALAVVTTLTIWVWQASGIASDVGENREEIQVVKPIIHDNEIAVKVISNDIEHLKTDVKQNAATQAEILSVQKIILEEVRK